MSHIWEQTYGLKPLLDDAELDKDDDGASKLKEYKFDTDPPMQIRTQLWRCLGCHYCLSMNKI